MEDLDTLRQEIDAIDDHIVELISKRFGITDAIGQLKAQDSLPVVDRSREKQFQTTRITRSKAEIGVTKFKLPLS
jgi:chorismate mutase